MRIIRWLDAQLNRTTMYRVLLYGLSLILITGFIVSFLGLTSFTPLQLGLSISVLSAACLVTNQVLARGFDIPSNFESSIITTLILACIVQPASTTTRIYGTLLIGVIAIASKYIITLHRQHIFNPAALAAVLVGVAGFTPITWWIASPELFWVVLVIGLLILRKTRHFKLFGIFIAVSLATIGGFAFLQGMPLLSTLQTSVVSWPLIFFGTVMLTEPMTMPAEKTYQTLFAILVGVLVTAQLKFGIIHTTPELALILGNIFAFAVNPRGRFILKLQSKFEMAPHIYDFVFVPVNKKDMPYFRFLPGQYLDWTLPHMRIDSRGN